MRENGAEVKDQRAEEGDRIALQLVISRARRDRFCIEGPGHLQRPDFSRIHHVLTGGRFSGRVARAPQQYALVVVEIHHHVRRFPQRPLIGRAEPIEPFQGLVGDDDRAVGIFASAENLQRSILIYAEFSSTCCLSHEDSFHTIWLKDCLYLAVHRPALFALLQESAGCWRAVPPKCERDCEKNSNQRLTPSVLAPPPWC